MSNLPEDKELHQAQKKTVSNLLSTVVLSSKFILAACCIVLLYGLFGDKLKGMFDFKDTTIATTSPQQNMAAESTDWNKVENGIHLRTGLVYDKGFDVVNGTCTGCHSAKLITQNRASREGWKEMIRWMQKTQGLWDLGENEPIILDYLASHYAPQEMGRRANLDIAEVEWYILNLKEE